MAVSVFLRFLFRRSLFDARLTLERFSIRFSIKQHRTRSQPEDSERVTAITRREENTSNFQAQKTDSIFHFRTVGYMEKGIDEYCTASKDIHVGES